jgi:hypothetical protein
MSSKSCWAKYLGNCSRKYSKEHIVSKCFFKEQEKITVQGVDWTKEYTSVIPIKTASAYILCNKHNEELSCLDAGAGKIQRSFKGFYEASVAFFKGDELREAKFHIDGKVFERWILKTLINHLIYSPIKYQNYYPEPYLVDLVFGSRSFEYKDGWGVYIVNPALQGNLMRDIDSISVLPLFLDKGKARILLGGLFEIFGWSFFLKVVTTENIRLIQSGVDFIDPKHYHPPKIEVMENGKFLDGLEIVFQY